MKNKVFFVKKETYGLHMYPSGSRRKYKRRPGDNLRTWQLKNDIMVGNDVRRAARELCRAFRALNKMARMNQEMVLV